MNDEHSTPAPSLDVNRIERLLSVMRYAISKAKPYSATPTSEAGAYANANANANDFWSPTARMTVNNMLEARRHLEDQLVLAVAVAVKDSLPKSMYSRLVLDPIRVQNGKSFTAMVAAPPPRFHAIVLDEIDLCTHPLRTVETAPNVYQRVARSSRGPRFNQMYAAPAPYCSPQTLYAELDHVLGRNRVYRRINEHYIPIDRTGILDSVTRLTYIEDELRTGEIGEVNGVLFNGNRLKVMAYRSPYARPSDALLRAIP